MTLRKILIIGGHGFVGQNLTDHLVNTHDVTVLTHEQMELLDSNAVELILKESADREFILHCAAFGGSRLTGYDEKNHDVVEKNLRMFLNVTRCVHPDQRLIYFGSGAEYDRAHFRSKMPEEYYDCHVPSDSYGFAKYAITKYISQQENMLNLRIFGLYGPKEDYRYKFISNAIIKSLMHLPITIAQNVIIDYLFIDDFLHLVENLLERPWPFRHMNITPSRSLDLLSLAEIINEETGNPAGINVLHEGWNREYTGNNEKLLKVVGPYEFTPYREGIRRLTAYYQSIWDSLDLDVVRADPFIAKCIVKQ